METRRDTDNGHGHGVWGGDDDGTAISTLAGKAGKQAKKASSTSHLGRACMKGV